MNFKSFLEESAKLGQYSKQKTYESVPSKIVNQKEESAIEKLLPHLEISKNKIKIETKKSSKCLIFDSRHRNKLIYPNTNSFQISFNPDSSATGAIIRNPIRNIVNFTINSAILPTVALNYPYIQLKIDELNNSSVSTTNGNSNDIYAILIPNKMSNSTSFVNCLIQNGCQNLPSTLSSLHKLSISFYDPADELIDFGVDHVGSIKNSVQTAIIVTVRYIESDSKKLNEELF